MKEKYGARYAIPPTWTQADREKRIPKMKAELLTQMFQDISQRFGDKFSIEVSFICEYMKDDAFESLVMKAIVTNENN